MHSFFSWLALNMDRTQKYERATWKLGLIHQGKEDLRQDPAAPDNPVTDSRQGQDLAFTLEPKCLYLPTAAKSRSAHLQAVV